MLKRPVREILLGEEPEDVELADSDDAADPGGAVLDDVWDALGFLAFSADILAKQPQ